LLELGDDLDEVALLGHHPVDLTTGRVLGTRSGSRGSEGVGV
jgi:hypothetical protein